MYWVKEIQGEITPQQINEKLRREVSGLTIVNAVGRYPNVAWPEPIG
jgi:hypothetical protein